LIFILLFVGLIVRSSFVLEKESMTSIPQIGFRSVSCDGNRTFRTEYYVKHLTTQPLSSSSPPVGHSFKDVMEILAMDSQEGAALRTSLTELLRGKNQDTQSYFFEMKPTSCRGDAEFAFLLIESPELASFASSPNPSAFQEHFSVPDSTLTSTGVTAFGNMGRDAVLITPAPLRASYGDLASFIRTADDAVIHEFWKRVATESIRALQIRQQTQHTPLWVSTSGLGVPWLHMRLDTRPKYYNWGPYKVKPPT